MNECMNLVCVLPVLDFWYIPNKMTLIWKKYERRDRCCMAVVSVHHDSGALGLYKDIEDIVISLTSIIFN